MGFIILPDSKWKSHPNVNKKPKSEWKLNESIPTSLYLLGIVRDKTIRSVRDLRGKHVKLLENMYNEAIKAIKDLYGVNENGLRIFIHYIPQYWHFHVHFTVLPIDHGIYVGHAILLQDIISLVLILNIFMIEQKYYFHVRINVMIHGGM